VDAMMALMVMRTCDQIEGGLPADVRMKMYCVIILDFGLGLFPLIGDVSFPGRLTSLNRSDRFLCIGR
jgi:hypothetical protein